MNLPEKLWLWENSRTGPHDPQVFIWVTSLQYIKFDGWSLPPPAQENTSISYPAEIPKHSCLDVLSCHPGCSCAPLCSALPFAVCHGCHHTNPDKVPLHSSIQSRCSTVLHRVDKDRVLPRTSIQPLPKRAI